MSIELDYEETMSFLRTLDFLEYGDGYSSSRSFRVKGTPYYFRIYSRNREHPVIAEPFNFFFFDEQGLTLVPFEELLELLPEEIASQFLFHIDIFRFAA